MTVIFAPSGGMYFALSGDTKPTNAVSGAVLFETNTRKIYFWSGAEWNEIDAVPAGSGETNTASNVGVGGIGVFKQKTGANLEFKNIQEGGSETISLTDDTGDNEIEIDVNASNLLISNLGGTLDDSQLSSNVMRTDLDNNIGDHFLDIGDIVVPANPSANFRRLFVDSTNNDELSIKKSDGTVISLEGAASGELNTASNVGTAGVGLFKQKTLADLEFKQINAGSSKITITDDTGNDEVDIDIGAGTITDTEIAAHTTTKITTTNKSLLNSSIMYEDEDNNLGTHYLNVGEIAAPTTPSANNARLYIDSTSNNLTIKKDSGSARDLELKQYPVVFTAFDNVQSAGVSNARIAPGQDNTHISKNNTSYITLEHELVITRFRIRIINNNCNATTIFSVLDDDVAVPNTSLNVGASTNSIVDSGSISQTIASGSEFSFKINTSGSSSGNLGFYFEVWGYWNMT